MKIFIHYIFEQEDEEMEQAVESLTNAGYNEDEIYAVPVESHED